MTKQVQRRRGTATQHTSFTGAEGELSVNTTNKSVHVHDNVTAGGFEAARADMDNVTSSSILTAAGITATTAELNYVDGVTSSIQTQLDGKAGTASPTFTGTLTTANLTATGTTTLASLDVTGTVTADYLAVGTTSDSYSQILINSSATGESELRMGDTDTDAGSVSYTNSNDTMTFRAAAGARMALNSTGLDITGTLTSDGLIVQATGANYPLIEHSSGNRIQLQPSYNYYNSFQHTFKNLDGSANTLTVGQTGDISFYEDTGTTPKFFWDASAESLGIGTSSPAQELDVNGQVRGVDRYYFKRASDNYSLSALARWDGSTGSPLTGIAGIHTVVGSEEASSSVVFAPSNTERMRIDSSGNVGINTSSAVPLDTNAQLLAIHGDAVGAERAQIKLTTTTSGQAAGDGFYIAVDDSAAYISQRENQPLVFLTNATERMRILADGSCRWTPDGTNPDMTLDASGNLLVGKTTTALADVGHNFNPSGFSFHTRSGGAVAYFNRTTSDGDIAAFYKNGSPVGSIGHNGTIYLAGTSSGIRVRTNDVIPATQTGAANDDALDLGIDTVRWKDLYLSGTIEIENGTGNVGVGKNALAVNTADYNTAVGWYAGNAVTGGYNTFVGAYSGGLVSSGTNNTILGRFSGNQSGLDIRTSSNNIVLSDGNGNPRVYVDSSGAIYQGSGFTTGTNATRFQLGEVTLSKSSTGFQYVNLYYNPNGNVGSIAINGSSTSYITTSDYRLKENVVEMTGATDRVKQLEPKRFNFIADADTTVDGFLAHEVQSVVPEAITGTKDAVDADGNPEYQGIDQSKLVPLLVATIKELEARITALENA